MGNEPARVTQDLTFAAIAVELHVGKSTFAELSMAAAILAILRNGHLETLEKLAADCDIKSHVVHDLLLDERRLSALIAEAHRLFKTMAPHEATIRQLIGGAR